MLDQPYDTRSPMTKRQIARAIRKGKPPKTHVARGTITTGDVADILEAKYHIMERFAEKYLDDIAEIVNDAVIGSMETLIRSAGSVSVDSAINAAFPKIEEKFKDFIGTGEVESVGIPGVPTEAALRGVDHRLTHPYLKSNPRRPSFVDTSLYVDSFKAWSD